MGSISKTSGRGSRTLVASVLAGTLALALVGMPGDAFSKGSGDRTSKYKSPKDYTHAKDWRLKGKNLVPFGHNPLYFPLKPGFKFIMERADHPDGPFRKEVKVLDQTEPFDLPGIGKFNAAVVQEDEFFEGRRGLHPPEMLLSGPMLLSGT